jgi:hypothetical protein
MTIESNKPEAFECITNAAESILNITYNPKGLKQTYSNLVICKNLLPSEKYSIYLPPLCDGEIVQPVKTSNLCYLIINKCAYLHLCK